MLQAFNLFPPHKWPYSELGSCFDLWKLVKNWLRYQKGSGGQWKGIWYVSQFSTNFHKPKDHLNSLYDHLWGGNRLEACSIAFLRYVELSFCLKGHILTWAILYCFFWSWGHLQYILLSFQCSNETRAL
jgi:hypothetical protein